MLGSLQRFQAGGGMNRDQSGAQSSSPAAGSGHGGWDVVKFEIQKNLQVPLPELIQHLGPCRDKEFKTDLDPTQSRQGIDQLQGLPGFQAVESQDQAIGVTGLGHGVGSLATEQAFRLNRQPDGACTAHGTVVWVTAAEAVFPRD